MHPSQRLRPMRPTHSWLQDRHSRIVLGSTGTRLHGEVRIGDLASHHTDQIAVAGAEGALGLEPDP